MATPRRSKPPAPRGPSRAAKKPAAAPPAEPTAPVAGPFDDLSREDLIELLAADDGGRSRISFVGKANARRIARKVRPRVLRPVKALSAGIPEEQARNQLIEGDNLQAMATLYRERSQVDLILTDPPYNTGGDWRYNDRWDEDPNDPGLGELVAGDEVGRHTKWMKFMWPRLQMMKAMLKPGGVLAICIDQRELFRLGQMLDELFGEHNRLAILNWQKSYSPRSDKRHVAAATEYILVYARDEEKTKTGLLPRTEVMDARYSSPDNDRRWKGGDLSAKKAKRNQGMVYAIQSPFTGDLHYPPPGSCWRLAQRELQRALEQWGPKYKAVVLDDDVERAGLIGVTVEELLPAKALMLSEPLAEAAEKAEKLLAEGSWPRVFFGGDGAGRPQLKVYLEDVKQGKVATTWWADEDYTPPEEYGSISWQHTESGHSQTGVSELDAILGDRHGFETVKPLQLFRKVVQLWCPSDGLVLDPFAGSGTTGHAVLEMNQVLGATRRFILIEQGRPEKGDSYARTLTAQRLARVISGDRAKGRAEPLEGGFSFSTLAKKVDAATLLRMERDEMVDTVIASHFDATRRRGSGLIPVDGAWRYLVARSTDSEGFFLVWDGPDANTDLTRSVYGDIAREAKAADLKAPYHVYARLHRYQTGTVRFYQIPDRILADFGLDLRDEPFAELGE